MKTHEICPICCEGTLHKYTFGENLKYKNFTIHVSNFESSKCDVCEACVATHAQTKSNKIIHINFQRALDGLLTTHEIVRIRKKLNLSQRQASEIIGGGGIAFSKYENGSLKQSISLDNMLRSLDKHPKLIEMLKEQNSLRRAFTGYTAEIIIPSPEPSDTANDRKNEKVGIIGQITNAAQTIFKPILATCNFNSSDETPSKTSGYVGWTL